LDGQFHLYQTLGAIIDDRDCLDFYPTNEITNHIFDGLYRKNHQIIPFCRRDGIDDGPIVIEHFIPSFTFNDLNNRNVSSRELLTWSAPLELAEHYQAFVEGKNNAETETIGASSLFYNCSSVSRFGQFCQYSFTQDVSQ
jgi:hypothetical protein